MIFMDIHVGSKIPDGGGGSPGLLIQVALEKKAAQHGLLLRGNV